VITFMRRHRRALQVGLLLVVAAFVASLFIFGAGGPGSDRAWVARVNGQDIPMERYQRRYQEYLETYTRVFRERFSAEMAERLGLAQQVVDDLVQEELVVQQARAEGLEVTDEELNAHIHALGAFQEAGRFSLRRYEDVLRRLGYSKTRFEAELRRRLTRSKVERLVRAGVTVTEAEVDEALRERHEQVRAVWAVVPTGPLAAAITPAETELESYLREHPGEFRRPERRRVLSVTIELAPFRPGVSAAEVEAYYRQHPHEFEEPLRVRAAHLVVRVPETGGSAAEDRARERAVEAIRRARAGEEFAHLARELSEDRASAERGGELGWVARGELMPVLEQALFALRPGDVTPEPVRSPLGYHVLKALEVRGGTRKPLAEVAPQIRERLAAEAAERAARARAEEVRARLLGAADFAAEARRLGLNPVESTIPRRERVPGLPPDPVEEAAFELARGGVSPPVRTPAGWTILKHVASLSAEVPPLPEIRDAVAAAVRRQRAEALALERARVLAGQAGAGHFLAAARSAGATTAEGTFSRARPAEGLPGDVAAAALRTPVGRVSDPVKTPQGVYVVKVLERSPPDLRALGAERERVAAELLARKQSLAWEAWMSASRGRARIEIAPAFLTRRG
jgi:peptidyl-prolyl cis-trans isomerase D